MELAVNNDGQRIIAIDAFVQLNKKSVGGLCWVLRSPVETARAMSNPGIAVSAMSEANL